MSDVLNLIFGQEFLLRALVVGVLISLCSALLGSGLVLKRFSMIGDGLSHVGFGAMAIACAVNVAPLYFALPVVIGAAFLLLRMNETGKIKGDAAIALISTGALAVGVMATSITTGMNIDIYNYMFGSILTMTDSDVLISSLLSIAVIILFVLFYNEIFAVTFDENFAKATGTKTSLYNMLVAALTAVTIVVGMRMMGALLISSLMIFPTVTSVKVCKSFRSVIITSLFVSVFCFVSGLFLSVKYETPTGASVVCFNIFVFAAFYLVRAVNLKSFGGKKVLKRAAVFFTAIALAVVYSALMLYGGTFKKSEENREISVVTTAFAQYDFARNVVGDKGKVEMLLAPGAESHTYEPTPGDIMKIRECDVFIYGGGESEKWVDSILESVGDEIKTVRMMDVTSLMHQEESEDGHNHSEHNEEEYDEHVWTSPYNAMSITQAICDAVVSADSENESYYRDNTESYLAELKKLDDKFFDAVEQSEKSFIIVGDRFPLRYLSERYGIEYYSAFPGCSAQTEANPVTISELIDKAEKENCGIIFKVDLGSGNVAETIAYSTGAEIRTLYSCHTVSAQDFSGGENYISLMTRNLESISEAMN